MRPYKGIIRITCLSKGKCPRSLRENVEPGCINCTQCGLTILTLEGMEIIKTTPEPRPPAPKTKSGHGEKKERPAAVAGGK